MTCLVPAAGGGRAGGNSWRAPCSLWALVTLSWGLPLWMPSWLAVSISTQLMTNRYVSVFSVNMCGPLRCALIYYVTGPGGLQVTASLLGERSRATPRVLREPKRCGRGQKLRTGCLGGTKTAINSQGAHPRGVCRKACRYFRSPIVTPVARCLTPDLHPPDEDRGQPGALPGTLPETPAGWLSVAGGEFIFSAPAGGGLYKG